MFIDSAVIYCEGGSGGKGCHSFEKSNHLKHPRPHGGDGGRGGSVILRATVQVHTLLDVQMRKTFTASDGRHGGASHKNGAAGENKIVRVPVGTEVYDDDHGYLLADLCRADDEVRAASGGAGGKGNHKHAEAEPGEAGEKKNIRLELKLIADVGLVGFPNAGKSTLISHLSNAKSRIAAFPFTTKEPVLGVHKTNYGEALVIADIPGLISGAHAGRGMGHKFLKHIERTRVLLQVVDMAGTDGRDPAEDYRIIREELSEYSRELLNRPILVLANKMDVPEARENLIKFKQSVNEDVLEISAATGAGLGDLSARLFKRVSPLREGPRSHAG